jgi:hypothetical protein
LTLDAGDTLAGARVVNMTGSEEAIQNTGVTLTQSPLYIVFADEASALKFQALLK